MKESGLHLSFFLAFFLAFGGVPAKALGVPITTKGDPALETAAAVIGIVAVGWTALEFVGGARAIAVAQADEDFQTDPPGITRQQFDMASRISELPSQGGWFSGSARAIAPASGSKGSELTTEVNAQIGFLSSSTTVNFPVRKQGKPDGSYSGWGAGHTSGFSLWEQRSIPPKNLDAQALQVIEFGGSLVINAMDLFVDPGAGNESFSGFIYDAWITPARSGGDLTETDAFTSPSNAFHVEHIAEVFVTLHASGPSALPFLSFDGGILSNSDFLPITLTPDGLFTTSLTAPVTIPVSFTASIADDVKSLAIFESLQSYALTRAAIPEPSTVLLLGTGLAGLLSYSWRRRKQAEKAGADSGSE